MFVYMCVCTFVYGTSVLHVRMCVSTLLLIDDCNPQA